MTTKLTNSEAQDIALQAQQRGEQRWQPLEFGSQSYLPQQIGVGSDLLIRLRNGLNLGIRHCQLRQELHQTRQHRADFELTAKFYLSGASQVRTPGICNVAPDYLELKGHHYLYHLPNQTEVEEWPADKLTHVVCIWADPSYFSAFNCDQTALSPTLQKLFEGDRSQRFHQPLGRITPSIQQLLQQLLHCPYTGLMKQMYLESKALELFAAQFDLWTEESTSRALVSLSAQDIEQLHQAREILIQQITDPPSLLELARQVGLNDHKLKRGFRQLFGTSAFEYLRDYRLHLAETLLRNPNLTIAGVAATVGYQSQSAFCHAFRRKFSISPKAYQLSQRS